MSAWATSASILGRAREFMLLVVLGTFTTGVRDLAFAQDSEHSLMARNSAVAALRNLGGNSQESIADAVVKGTVETSDTADTTFTLYVNQRGYLLQTSTGQDVWTYSVVGNRGITVKNGKIRAISSGAAANHTSNLFPVFDHWASLITAGASAGDDGTVMDAEQQCSVVKISGRDSTPDTEQTSSALQNVKQESPMRLTLCGPKYELRSWSAVVQLGDSPFVLTPVLFRYDNYASRNGVTYPTKITKFIYDKPVAIYHLTSVSLNQGLREENFFGEVR